MHASACKLICFICHAVGAYYGTSPFHISTEQSLNTAEVESHTSKHSAKGKVQQQLSKIIHCLSFLFLFFPCFFYLIFLFLNEVLNPLWRVGMTASFSFNPSFDPASHLAMAISWKQPDNRLKRMFLDEDGSGHNSIIIRHAAPLYNSTAKNAAVAWNPFDIINWELTLYTAMKRTLCSTVYNQVISLSAEFHLLGVETSAANSPAVVGSWIFEWRCCFLFAE